MNLAYCLSSYPQSYPQKLCISPLGLRSKELASLKISDVVEPNGQIKKVLRLLASYTKGAKLRDVSLENKSVIKSLQDYITARTVDDGLTFNYSAPLFKSQKKTAFSANAMVRVLGGYLQECWI